MTVRVDKKLLRFIEKSRGKNLITRFVGKNKYADTTERVGDETKIGERRQFQVFLDTYKESR